MSNMMNNVSKLINTKKTSNFSYFEKMYKSFTLAFEIFIMYKTYANGLLPITQSQWLPEFCHN